MTNDLFFSLANDGITKVNRSTRKIVKLGIPANGNISFDGESIFYKNEQGVLTRYDVSGNETYTYENIVAYDFCMDEQSIYYVSRSGCLGLYSCGKDGNNKELISDIPASPLPVIQAIFMYYQKEEVRKSLYPKAIDSREQRAKWACLHAHLATAARGNNPAARL